MTVQDESAGETVVRYCPECGTRVKAKAELLGEPRKCPSCKRMVAFYDYPREDAAPIAEAEEAREHLDRKIYNRFLYGGSAALALLFLSSCVAILKGQFGALLVLSVVVLVLGQFGFLAFMDSRARFATLKKGYEEALRRQRFAEQLNRDLSLKYNGFRVNFGRIEEDERARCRAEAEAEFQRAKDERETALAESETALQRVKDERERALTDADAILQRAKDERRAAERELERANSFMRRAEGMLAEASAKDQACRAMAEKVRTAERWVLEARERVAETMANEETLHAMAHRLLQDTRKNVKRRLTPNNFASCKDQFLKTVDFCRRKGYGVSQADEEQFVEELKQDYKEAVRTQLAKEEQQRIKARIREEQKVEREIQRALEQAEAEQRAIERALAAALAETHDEHSAQVEELKRRLQEAEERSRRAMSMAQQTRAGNVYIISNIGSFGDGLYKIGMTRRLEPMDRIKELGDASVPFPFDVHMMISCEDAPALENALHRSFHKRRLNRVNLRKEFFRVDLEEIRSVVLAHHGEVEYVADRVSVTLVGRMANLGSSSRRLPTGRVD